MGLLDNIEDVKHPNIWHCSTTSISQTIAGKDELIKLKLRKKSTRKKN